MFAAGQDGFLASGPHEGKIAEQACLVVSRVLPISRDGNIVKLEAPHGALLVPPTCLIFSSPVQHHDRRTASCPWILRSPPYLAGTMIPGL